MSNENFTINAQHMSAKQFKNVGKLLTKAEKLGWFDYMHFNPMIQIAYNSAYNNTYIWSEDQSYTLFINDDESTIKALHTCYYDGEETFRNASNDSEVMEKWVNKLNLKSEKKEEY